MGREGAFERPFQRCEKQVDRLYCNNRSEARRQVHVDGVFRPCRGGPIRPFGIAFVALAVLAMDPASGVDEDVFAAGSALLLSATQQASHLATRLDSLIYGHVALAQLADVLNAS